MWKVSTPQPISLTYSGTVKLARHSQQTPGLENWWWSETLGDFVDLGVYDSRFYQGRTLLTLGSGSGMDWLVVTAAVSPVPDEAGIPGDVDIAYMALQDVGDTMALSHREVHCHTLFTDESGVNQVDLFNWSEDKELGLWCKARQETGMEGLWGSAGFTDSMTWQIVVEGCLEKWVDVLYMPTGRDYSSHPWREHWIDNDPCGLPPTELVYGYRLTGNQGSVKLYVDGVLKGSAVLPEGVSVWNPGGDGVTCWCDGVETTWYTPVDLTEVASITMPYTVYNGSLNLTGDNGTGTINNNQVTWQTKLYGYATGAATLNGIDVLTACSAYTSSISVVGAYLDGSSLVGSADCSSREYALKSAPGQAYKNGVLTTPPGRKEVDYDNELSLSLPGSLNAHYAGSFGVWTTDWRPAAGGDSLIHYDGCPAVARAIPFPGIYDAIEYPTIKHPNVLGEPEFADGDLGDAEDCSYADRRLPIVVQDDWSAFQALKLVVQEEKVLWAFDSSWTATDCTVTPVAGGIQITATGTNPKIEKTFSRTSNSTISFQGARFAQLAHTSNATDNLELTLDCGGDPRTWDISASKPEFDLLGPKNKSGADTTRTLINKHLPASNHEDDSPVPYEYPTWGWGVHYPGKVTIAGFESGKTYTLNTLKILSKSAEDGGFCGFAILPQAHLVGKAIGSNDAVPDALGPYFAGYHKNNTGTTIARYYAQVLGYVIIDGVRAAEIIGGYFYYVEYPEASAGWQFAPVHISDASNRCSPLPTNGFFEIQTLASDNEDVFGNDSQPLHYLTEGLTTSTNRQCELGAVLKVDKVACPVNTGIIAPTATCRKAFRGGSILTFVDESRSYKPTRIKSIGGTGIQAVDTTLNTNKLGFLMTSSVNWLSDLTIKTLDTTPEGSCDLPVTNRAYSPITIKGIIAGETGAACNATRSRRTNRIYIVHNVPVGLALQVREPNGDIKSDRAVSIHQSDSSLGIAVLPGRKDELVVIYSLDGSIHRITSKNEGRTWGEAVSIVSGKNPDIAISRSTEILVYVTGGKLWAKRRRGDNTSWDSPIEIAAATDSDIPALTLNHSESTWVCVVSKSDGTITRYKSTNNGRTWVQDE